MKKFLFLTLAFILCGGAAMADGPTDRDPIGGGGTGPRPRSLNSHIDYTIYDNGANVSLVFVFSENIGSAVISITNLSTGECYVGMCLSTPGTYTVNIDNESACYEIVITPDEGLGYTGFFTL